MRRIVVVWLLGVSLQAQAHDLWLEREAAGLTLYYGHRHSGHAGAELVEYRPEQVRAALCLDAQGERSEPPLPATYPLRLPAHCAVAYALTSSGYWTKTLYGTRNVPKSQAQMPLQSWLSFEGVKRIERWTPAAGPLTQELELTPLSDPLTLRPGDKLRLQVTFQGRALAGAVVSYDDSPRGTSDAEGRINLRLRHGGLQMIQASFRQPTPSALADEIVHASTLVFELPGS